MEWRGKVTEETRYYTHRPHSERAAEIDDLTNHIEHEII